MAFRSIGFMKDTESFIKKVPTFGVDSSTPLCTIHKAAASPRHKTRLRSQRRSSPVNEPHARYTKHTHPTQDTHARSDPEIAI